jgi:hypothetical protein
VQFCEKDAKGKILQKTAARIYAGSHFLMSVKIIDAA